VPWRSKRPLLTSRVPAHLVNISMETTVQQRVLNKQFTAQGPVIICNRKQGHHLLVVKTLELNHNIQYNSRSTLCIPSLILVFYYNFGLVFFSLRYEI
jgi:hypothetical protein